MELVMRTIAVAIAAGGCTTALTDPSPAPDLDRAFFRCEVQPVLSARCAFGACHASARRPLRLYAVGRMRLDVAWDRLAAPLTTAELDANYEVARGFVADVQADSYLLSKPLDTRAGGLYHRGQDLFGDDDVFLSTSDPGYRQIAAWIAGQTAPADCLPTEEVGP
jgi:hypothetical protein